MKMARTATIVGVVTAAVALGAVAAIPSFADTKDSRTARVSVSNTGEQGAASRLGGKAAVSDGGRFTTFTSDGPTFVPGDTNSAGDVFVRDALTGTTTRVSVSENGEQADRYSFSSSISADGRYVAFASYATNLVPDDTNENADVFVRDTVAGTTTRVSVTGSGADGNAASSNPVISADGRQVTFGSLASNLVRGDTNRRQDVFVRDLAGGTTTRVNVSSSEEQATDDAAAEIALTFSSVVAGRYVAFRSGATNLVADDTNGTWDVFVRDLVEGTTVRASVSDGGAQADARMIGGFSITADGRHVVFESPASNLVDGDTDGKVDVFRRDLVAGTTTLIELAGAGESESGFLAQISPDGRRLAYSSSGYGELLVRDLVTGDTTAIDVSGDGAPGNGASWNKAFSPDGSFIAFESTASNLVDGDTNAGRDVFVRELT